MSNYIQEAESGFEQTLAHFAKELKNLRTNRATAELVEDIRVEAYGQSMDLKGVASITIPDARTIQIEPWDKNLAKDIEKALMGSGLGITPKVAGAIIHLNLPPMTEENRKDLVKLINQKAEHTRISIRNTREEVREQIIKDEKAKTITEDEKYSYQEKLDEAVSKANKKVEELVGQKEKDVMSI
jgi:ribosome recycling factor